MSLTVTLKQKRLFKTLQHEFELRTLSTLKKEVTLCYNLCKQKKLWNHLTKTYHFINEVTEVREAGGVSLKLQTPNVQMS